MRIRRSLAVPIIIAFCAQASAHRSAKVKISEDGYLQGIPIEYGRFSITLVRREEIAPGYSLAVRMAKGEDVLEIPACVIAAGLDSVHDVQLSASWYHHAWAEDIDPLPPYLAIGPMTKEHRTAYFGDILRISLIDLSVIALDKELGRKSSELTQNPDYSSLLDLCVG